MNKTVKLRAAAPSLFFPNPLSSCSSIPSRVLTIWYQNQTHSIRAASVHGVLVQPRLLWSTPTNRQICLMEARLRPLREVHRTLRQRRAARGGAVRLPALFTVRCEKIQEQVDVAALCSDEHGIALEGKRTDLEQWRPDLVKRVEEVACVNKLLERERRLFLAIYLLPSSLSFSLLLLIWCFLISQKRLCKLVTCSPNSIANLINILFLEGRY